MAQRRRSPWALALRPALVIAGLLAYTSPVIAQPAHSGARLDRVLEAHARTGAGRSPVVVMLRPGADPSVHIRDLGGRVTRQLQIINAVALDLPSAQLRKLAAHPGVVSLHFDRPIASHASRTASAVGVRQAQREFGYTGAGVGVAVIDSGLTSWHDDLTPYGSQGGARVVGGQRVTGFVDLVNGRSARYDDNGHGTHVAGIIAGNGLASHGDRAGIAPGAHLVSLKVLDDRGRGTISHVIAALDWVVTNGAAHNIRVVNLSVGAAVTESYTTDPLTLAAKRAVDAGVVVVAAAGNLGVLPDGRIVYGGIAAPGNAPWVLTVGASDTKGTVHRADDVMGLYSSRGPTLVDNLAKPDLVAPGTGIVSLSVPNSHLYVTRSEYLVEGKQSSGYKPYLTLTGTSMAAPAVAGTVALMLQANPSLTPNLVKGILQYTAQRFDYDPLTQGAGFLNAHGAIQLARFFARAQPGDRYATSTLWSKQVIWGNYLLEGGVITPDGSAWAQNIVWGTAFTADGENVVWGTVCGDRTCENIVWGTVADYENRVWGTAREGENIVWGTARNGENIVWGTARDGENIVWGTSGGRNIVWGTACGGRDCENIVWGTGVDLQNIVWGTARGGENIVWGTVEGRNIVWGTAKGENIVWGTVDDENVVWGTSALDGPMYEDRPDDFVLVFWDDGEAEAAPTGGGF